MLYNHLWGSPVVTVVRSEGRHVHVPMQTCSRCDTTRNPFTKRLLRMTRAIECREAEARAQDFRAQVARLRQQLKALAADGVAVDLEYGSKRRSSSLELPLAYKD